VSVLKISSYSAREIWLKSAPKENRLTVKFDDLYPNLMAKYKEISKIEHRVPSKDQLAGYFALFLSKHMEEEKKIDEEEDDDNDINGDVRMKSEEFDEFYVWFLSMCGILSDLKCVYDNHADPDNDALIGLFYDTEQAHKILESVEETGAFFLRLSGMKNVLIVSYKNEDNSVIHCTLIRVEPNIYQIGRARGRGKAAKQLPIDAFISSAKQLKFLCTENNVLVAKSTYFPL